jgi:hypothetical protein
MRSARGPLGGMTRLIDCRRAVRRALLAGVALAMTGSGSARGQELLHQSATLKGIDTVRVTVGSVIPEALRAGVQADSLVDLALSILHEHGIAVQPDAGVDLRIDVLGFQFGSRISFTVKLALEQPVVLVASGRNTRAQTWVATRDAESEDTELVAELNRLVRSALEEFAGDREQANTVVED